MRKIAIIGAGQAGLLLAIGLVKNGFNVSLYSQEDSDDYLNGKIRSSQGLFHSALEIERSMNLNYWDNLAPRNNTISFSLSDNSYKKKELSWIGATKNPYQSIDQRIKFSEWLKEFCRLGGDLIIKNITIEDTYMVSSKYELTIIAAGKGELNKLFNIDKKRSMYQKPQRMLSCMYVMNMETLAHIGVRANIVPGVGEYFNMPGLTKNGQCNMMLFEGIPNREFDCWSNNNNNMIHLEQAKELLRTFIPWEAELCKNIELTDKDAVLIGSYTPYVKKPIAKLSSGKLLLGLGDTLVLNDPIAGQGANTATKAAYFYLNQIILRENKAYTEEWMLNTFEHSWSLDGKNATKWSNLMLEPPTQHVANIMQEASKSSEIANTLADGFNNPNNLFPWLDG